MEAPWRIIGDDGLHYGPVPFETLREWAAEGRVVAETAVRKGDGAFRAASTWPELAVLFERDARRPHAPPLPEGAPPVAGAARLPDDFRIGDFFREAWRILTFQDAVLIAALCLLVAFVGSVSHVGFLAALLLGGPLLVGFWRMVLARVDGRSPRFEVLFEGFERFGDAVLAWFLTGVLIALGYFLLILPGVYLSILWLFTYPVLAETRLDFWGAMKRSADLTQGYRWDLLAMLLVSAVLLVAGFLAAVVGFFVALPVVITAFGVAYRFLERRAPAPGEPLPPAAGAGA